ncbi:MAG: DNA polymerase III subunit gamma/tau [Flavobacteriaceae bacterium]|nr:DNA polymerase III subunit gamma/tau [Flavobacteriaceae bacterium]MBL6683878.1 DNA polymerase III subunit gamma/tau [Flavobacteriaceae bacterium]
MSKFVVSSLKYRPNLFEKVIGQENITKTLKNSIADQKIPSAILFCGPRGVGKTSCARIFAREINKFTLHDDLSFNIFELDAASNNKVEDIRDLIDKVRIPPQIGKYKVYIIDEVHMLSKSAENAFLKTLEEPPPYIVFILATTEKNKILPTILSRCQIYDFNRVNEIEITKNLQQICENENVEYDIEALKIISSKSDGSIRDSLTILDRLISFTNKNITIEETSKTLNVLDEETYINIVEKTITGSIVEVIMIFNSVTEKGFDEKEFLIGLANHYRNLLIIKSTNSQQFLINESTNKVLLEQSKKISKSEIIERITKIENSIFKFSEIENKRLLVEILLMKISSIKDKDSGIETSEIEKKKSELKKPDQIQEITNSVEIKESSKNEKDLKKNEIEFKPKKEINTNKINTDVSAFSLSSLKLKKKINDEIKKIESSKEKKDQDLEIYNLKEKWNLYSNELEKKGKGNYSSLLTLNEPTIEDKKNIVYNVPTKSSKKELIEIKQDLTRFLKSSLKNDYLVLKFEVNNEANKEFFLTPKEKYEKLKEINPTIEKLKTDLKLDF